MQNLSTHRTAANQLTQLSHREIPGRLDPLKNNIQNKLHFSLPSD
jgi:hypothetical protein